MRDLLDKVDMNPGDYDSIIKSEHIARYLKEMFNTTSPSGLTVCLNDSDTPSIDDMNDSVLDLSANTSDVASSDVLENSLVFIKSFFNFDNYIIITIKYFNVILDSIKEKESTQNEKSVEKATSKKTSVREVESDDDVEVVPNKRVKQ